MGKDNSMFFKKKKIWSEVKDQLLGCYLKPYLNKVFQTNHPVFYLDCFAGKGKFEDGNDGSPRIALNIIRDCLKNTKNENAVIRSCFIDLNYANELKENLSEYENIEIISGRYEDNIHKILQNKQGQNVFLYIDPYGIKALNCELFEKLVLKGFYSIELLINMNSFGFMRQACNVKKVSYNDIESLDDIIEYEPTTLDSSQKSVEELNEIAGGDYWQAIVEDYYEGKIDGYEAEKIFIQKYCERLRKKYKYVLNMPIRLRKGNRPKYRMIHLTNHADGCILMYENICKRWEVLENIQSGGQLCFFSNSVEEETVDLENIENLLYNYIKKVKQDTRLNEILAEFITENGILCNREEINKMLKELELSKKIIVTRDPAKTKLGKPSAFITDSNKKKVFIRCKE